MPGQRGAWRLAAGLSALALAVQAGLAREGPERLGAWIALEQVPEDVWHRPGLMRPDLFLPVEIDLPLLTAQLRLAPTDQPGLLAERGQEPGVVVSLPHPDGTARSFRVVRTEVMHPDLAARFPQIGTFRGENTDNPAESVSITISEHGVQVTARSPEELWHIDPLSLGDDRRHAVYREEDSGFPSVPGCTTFGEPMKLEKEPGENAQGGGLTAQRAGPTLRTYRLAVATTGEYTQRFGGTVSTSLAQVVATTNRVNQIWLAEFSVQFQLVANNDQVIYTDPNTDPYTNSVNADMLSENVGVMNSRVGNANYDIGHVFGTAGGGVASLGVLCLTNSKAQGVSSNSFATNTAAQTFSHELGHQFNAPHTFNSNEPNTCGPQRSSSGAFEPGSGSTTMSYGTFCGSDNLGARNDYFHTSSFDFINNLIGSRICGTQTSTGNTAPTVNAGPDRTIPANVFFELSATGSDAENDPITYTWDQRDNGGSTGFALATGDPGFGPIIRSRPGTAAANRVIPPLTNILNNTWQSVRGEILPTFNNRVLTFRVVGRDGRGGVNWDEARYLVRSVSPTPFRVLSPNAPGTLSGPVTITWDVGGTSGAPFGNTLVNILLSTNGGSTFPTVLASNVPNTGSAYIRLPQIVTSTARIRINPVNNIYFDVSDANFTIQRQSCVTDYNRDGLRNLDDLGDYITDFYAEVPIPGGLQASAPTFSDRADVGFGTACPDAANAGSPYAVDAYRRFGFRVAYSPDNSQLCPVSPAPSLDYLNDYITDFYSNDPTCVSG
jgi:hypothetical protein